MNNEQGPVNGIKNNRQQVPPPNRLQEAQFNRRRAAALNPTSSITAQSTAGGSKEEMSPGAVSGMKPGTQKPTAVVLPVVKQVMIFENSINFKNLQILKTLNTS
jgi:hypothetical protein